MEIFQHFKGNEKIFAKKTLAKAEGVGRSYIPKLFDFLDPREQEVLSSIVNYVGGVDVHFEGIFEGAERCRAIVYPIDAGFGLDTEILIFKARYLSKFVHIEHRNVLGSLLSLGIVREKIGDIHVDGDAVYFVVSEDIASFIENNLTKIGTASIKLERISRDEVPEVAEEWIERGVSVTSMRLDVVVTAITNLSRPQSQNLIESGKVKLNWREDVIVSKIVELGDIISIRGAGRKKIMKFSGQSKKGKMRIIVGELNG